MERFKESEGILEKAKGELDHRPEFFANDLSADERKALDSDDPKVSFAVAIELNAKNERLGKAAGILHKEFVEKSYYESRAKNYNVFRSNEIAGEEVAENEEVRREKYLVWKGRGSQGLMKEKKSTTPFQDAAIISLFVSILLFAWCGNSESWVAKFPVNFMWKNRDLIELWGSHLGRQGTLFGGLYIANLFLWLPLMEKFRDFSLKTARSRGKVISEKLGTGSHHQDETTDEQIIKRLNKR